MAIYKDVEPLEIVIYKGGNEDFDRGAKFILEKLDALPTADVVEVVRCGKCIYANFDGTICHYDVGRDVKPDHYCGYGERKCDK